MIRGLKNNISFGSSLAPDSQTTTVDGTDVDLRGFDSAVALIHIGAVTGSSPSFTFELQESDGLGSFTAVADADLQGTEPVITAGNVVHRIGYIGSKRFLRMSITDVQGASPAALCSAGILRGHPHHSPV